MKEKKDNFDNYLIEDDEDDRKRYTMWSIMPVAMVNPQLGWSRARDEGPTPEIATLRFFIPICIFAALADFLIYLYPGQYTFPGVLVGSVVTLCSFFIGYYLSLVLTRLLLRKHSKSLPATDYGKLLIMGSTATLAFFHILMRAFPMFDFILEFLPLWTIYLVFEGIRQDHHDQEYSIFSIGMVCLIIICSPILIEWILSLFV